MFWVQCYNTDGNAYATADMDIGISADAFRSVLESDCSFLSGKISVTKLTTTYSSSVLGTEF